MREEEVETVAEHCKHPNCIYRTRFYGEPICYYAVIENVPSRGCKISECDKYKTGVKTQPRLKPDMIIEWDYELYE